MVSLLPEREKTRYSQLTPFGHTAITDARYILQIKSRFPARAIEDGLEEISAITDSRSEITDNFIVLTFDKVDTTYFSNNMKM